VDDKNLPELNQGTYVKETALALWDNLPRVILAGFLFTLVCLPSFLAILFGFIFVGIFFGIILIGPGWATMNAAIAGALLREPFPSIPDFFRTFRRFYRRGVVLGAFMAVPLTAASLTLPLLQILPVPIQVWIGLGADLAGILILSTLYLYTFPQIVLYNVGVRMAMQNSLLLVVRYLSNSLGLISLMLLFCLLAYKVSYMLFIILPAFWLVFVINNCRMVLQLELGDAGHEHQSNDPE
jgi:uncharacterized membrane protein YesL